MADDPKRVAAAILGPLASDNEASEAADDESGETSTETVALGAVADEMLAALKANDRTGLIEALRSLKISMRE